MTNEEITNGLMQLGFNSGWVITGNEITLWENEELQPTDKQIADASKLWNKTLQAEAEALATEKAALLQRLGITADEAALLLS